MFKHKTDERFRPNLLLLQGKRRHTDAGPAGLVPANTLASGHGSRFNNLISLKTSNEHTRLLLPVCCLLIKNNPGERGGGHGRCWEASPAARGSHRSACRPGSDTKSQFPICIGKRKRKTLPQRFTYMEGDAGAWCTADMQGQQAIDSIVKEVSSLQKKTQSRDRKEEILLRLRSEIRTGRTEPSRDLSRSRWAEARRPGGRLWGVSVCTF